MARLKEELKQKNIQVKAERLLRLEIRKKIYRHNRISETDAEKFYKDIRSQRLTIEKTEREK